MRRALVEPSGRVAQVVEPGEEFDVALPLCWKDAPDDVAQDSATFDGAAFVAKPAVPPPDDGPRVASVPFGKHTVNTFALLAGQKIERHVNSTAHSLSVVVGEIEIERDGAVETYDAHSSTTFLAGEAHEIRAVTDAVVVNIF